jgi:hypothetical protein
MEARRGMILAVRAVHSLFTVFFLSCLGYVYYAALTRRRGPLLLGAAGALVIEGAVVAGNGGECPLGPVHRRYGDEKTFFELLLPPAAARAAVPVLAGVALAGIGLALARRPGRVSQYGVNAGR